MEKKVFLWSMMAFVLSVMLSVGLSSCGDDDDDNGIVGTWVAYDGDEEITFTFNSDNTGVYMEKRKIQGTFIYSMSSNQKGTITIKDNDSYSGHSYEIYTFSIKDGSLFLYDDDGDLELVFTKQGGSNNNSSKVNNSVVGTWSGKDGRHQLSITFKSGGTGTYVSNYYDSYSGTETETGTFTYTMEGSSKGMIIVKVRDSYSGSGTDIFYFVIEGNMMFLYEDGYGDDLEWVLTKQ